MTRVQRNVVLVPEQERDSRENGENGDVSQAKNSDQGKVCGDRSALGSFLFVVGCAERR